MKTQEQINTEIHDSWVLGQKHSTTNFADVQKVAYAAANDLMSGKKHSKEYEAALKSLLAAADRIKKFL